MRIEIDVVLDPCTIEKFWPGTFVRGREYLRGRSTFPFHDDHDLERFKQTYVKARKEALEDQAASKSSSGMDDEDNATLQDSKGSSQ